MKPIVATTLLLIITTHAFCQGSCSKFRDGVFQINAQNVTVIITRSGSRQTEVVNGDKSTTLTFIVAWLDDCTYTLKPTSEAMAKMPGTPPNALLTVHIDKVSANSYTQTSTSNFSDIKASCEVFRVKKVD